MRALRLVLALGLGLATSSASAQTPTRDPRTIVGHDLEEISRARRVEAREGDVVRFDDGLAVRLAEGRIVEMTLRVPDDLACGEVARWLGLEPLPGTAPLRRAAGCEWPGLSERHVLVHGLAARLEGGVLRVWQRARR